MSEKIPDYLDGMLIGLIGSCLLHYKTIIEKGEYVPPPKYDAVREALLNDAVLYKFASILAYTIIKTFELLDPHTDGPQK